MFIVTLFITDKKYKHFRCPSTAEWINQETMDQNAAER